MSPQIFFNTIRLRSKNIFFHGAIFAFYVICVITTFIIGLYGFARMAGLDLGVDDFSDDHNHSLTPDSPDDDNNDLSYIELSGGGGRQLENQIFRILANATQ
jgi:hypothetical protein